MDGPKANNDHVEVIRKDAPVTNSAQLTLLSKQVNGAMGTMYLQQRMLAITNGLAQIQSNSTVWGGDPFIRSTFLRFLLDGNRDIDSECGYPSWLTPDHYRAMYDREGAAARVVHCEPEESWVEDPDLYEDEDPQTDTKFEKAWKKVLKDWNVWHHLLRIDILSGIGQYGVLLIGIDDGKELWEPVEGINDDGTTTGENKYKLLYLRPFDETVTFIKAREVDTNNPRYGKPTMYRIEFRDFPNWGIQAGEIIARDVHWTRVIHVADNRKMSEVFGIPRMQQVWNRLYDLRKIMAASGEGYWKGAFPGISFEIMPEIADQGIDFTDDDKKALRQEMDDYQKGLQRYIALNGMHANPLPIQAVPPDAHAESNLKNIAIAKDIPYRVLFGSEEAKLAGTQDGKKWARRIRRRQLRYVEPLLIRPFVDRLIAFGVLPQPKEYFVDWPDLNAPADIDKAAIANQIAGAMAQYVQSGASQLVPPDVFLTKILGWTPEEAKDALESATKFTQSQMLDDGTQELEDHEGSLGTGGVQQDTGSVLLQDALSGTGTIPKKGKNRQRVDSQMVNQPAIPSLNAEDSDGHWVTMDGTHVFIKDGKIDKGPDALVGKKASGNSWKTEDFDDTVRASRLYTPHEVKDKAKFAKMVEDLEENGWQGRPVLAEKYGEDFQAWTGSHRIAAAKKAGVDVPVVLIDGKKISRFQKSEGGEGDELLWDSDGKSRDDDDRVHLLKRVDKRAAKLMQVEIEANEKEDAIPSLNKRGRSKPRKPKKAT